MCRFTSESICTEQAQARGGSVTGQTFSQTSCAVQAGGAAEALIEQYNDQLREIRERGLADTDAAEPLRELLRALRDQPRITEGSVKVRCCFMQQSVLALSQG